MNHPLEIDGLEHEPSCFVFRAPALTVARPLCSCGALISDLQCRLSSSEKRAEEAEADVLTAQDHCDRWIEKFYTAQNERDEARSSLGRAEEVLQELWAKSDPFELPETLIEKVRSALHIPRG